MTHGDHAVLRAAGAAVVVDLRVPRLLHVGRDLGAVDVPALRSALEPPARPASFDEPVVVALLPDEAGGWLGRPGLAGHRDGRQLLPRLTPAGVESAEDRLTVTSTDEEMGIEVRSELVLDAAGVLHVRHSVLNAAQGVLDVTALDAAVPIPPIAVDVLDLGGTWIHERSVERTPLGQGTRLREIRRGRTGHDGPLLMVAGTPGFSFRRGEVWAMHVAWSGDQSYAAERVGGTGLLRGGELLRPGEIRLRPGERYTTPWVLFTWSDEGLDGVSARFHRSVRARPAHPRRPRPVVLNTWEAVYFDHDLDRLVELARVAAAVGVERFVLDDGWFRGRRDDRAGLGDWHVDDVVWPQGLHPLCDEVRALGMDVGLWVEPEMVNPDSDLARARPEWVLGPPGRTPRSARHQQVLDVAQPAVAEHLFERLDALVTEYGLAFLKWDHNRDLSEAVGPDGRAASHRQTSAVYALLDRLRAAHPALEIESCASGGGRVDLGILARTDRVWASDTVDAVERQRIQRWTGLLLPPELVGSHVGPPVAHTTGRPVGLGLRCLTALFAHAGIEWDLTRATDAERARIAAWVALYRELRPMLHGGVVVRSDDEPAGMLVHGVVATDGTAAAHAVVRLASGPDPAPGPLRLPGLDRRRDYRVRVRGDFLEPTRVPRRLPPWWAAATADGLCLSGAVLTDVGLPFPALRPAEGLLVHLTSPRSGS